jgi:hypothetical protein
MHDEQRGEQVDRRRSVKHMCAYDPNDEVNQSRDPMRTKPNRAAMMESMIDSKQIFRQPR